MRVREPKKYVEPDGVKRGASAVARTVVLVWMLLMLLATIVATIAAATT